MGILDINNNPNTIYNAMPNRNLANAYNEVLNAQPVLNNPNLGGANFAPKQNLMDIYKQASAKNTPSWAMALSNAMPSIGEIIALGATKGAFNQGRVAEGLDKQKQRQMAYNQWLKENEQQQAKDFVQMAKEQLGMDREDEERELKKQIDERNFNYQVEQDNKNFDLKKAIQDLAQKQWEKEFGLKSGLTNAQIKKLGIETDNLLNPNKNLTTKDLIDLENLKKLQRENDPEYIAKQEQKKKVEEENKQIIEEANVLYKNKAITAEQFAQIVSDPQSGKNLKDRSFLGRLWGLLPLTDNNKLVFDDIKNNVTDIKRED